MKHKIKTLLLASFAAMTVTSNAAVTITIKNFTSTSVGVPIVDSTGAAVAKSSIVASAGIFTTLPDFSTASAATILAAFTALDSTPVANSSFTGAYSANDMTSGAYPSNFSGAAAYMVVGNGATLATSTLIAVYATGSTFTAVDGVGNAAVTIAATDLSKWVYGVQKTVTTQPVFSVSSSGSYATGIQLTSVPEPSAALLGLLGVFGLVRRRR